MMEGFILSGYAGFRHQFYLVSPNETSFEKVSDVPNYVDEAFPFFTILVLLERLVLAVQGKDLPRWNDALSSLNNGILSLLHSLVFRPIELVTYIWVYDRLSVVTLPWDSLWTWTLGLVGIDFGYYWVHRFGHEVNIFWAAHQTHHSSEDYNLTTALRQGAFQKYCSWVFYLPVALVLPPSVFLVHLQFNLLYQFWVHTEVVNRLGPLEYILCTPSHHRVHHGRNPYCIDKNYGGVFIIWDRIFGTFEPEGDTEKVAYGLVHNLNSWNPLFAQICHLEYILHRVTEVEGWGNKLAVFWKGPGWSPGKPRLGLLEDIPQVEYPNKKYNSSLPVWAHVYVWLHFAISVLLYQILAAAKGTLPAVWILAGVVFLIISLTSFGTLYDNKRYAPILECVRCVLWLLVTPWIWPLLTSSIPTSMLLSMQGFFLVSAVGWAIFTARQVTIRYRSKLHTN